MGHDPRRGDWLNRKDCRIANEDAKDEPSGPGGAWREKALPTFAPERLANVLIRRPSFPPWSRQVQGDTFESIRIAEIGHVKTPYSVAPHVPRKLLHRWDAPLCQVAIPLGPQGFLLICEIDGVDDPATLPPVIARRLWPEQRGSEVRDLTQPRSGDVNRLDVERQQVGPQTAPGDSSSETTRATRRALPRAISSSGFWSSSASIGFDSHTGM